MKVLGIDTSSNPASCAVSDNETVLAEFYINNKKTHSQTLLGMIDSVKSILELDLSEIDVLAVSKGPGSFTGLRIGSATVKGLALALEIPVAEISTLEMMAYQMYAFEGLICPVMDARRSEVYTGIYRFEKEELVTVKPDTAIPVSELINILNDLGQPVIMLGDGVCVNEDRIKKDIKVEIKFAPGFINRQRASALCLLARKYALKGELTDGDMHRPVYLRVSQAERERAERIQNGGLK